MNRHNRPNPIDFDEAPSGDGAPKRAITTPNSDVPTLAASRKALTPVPLTASRGARSTSGTKRSLRGVGRAARTRASSPRRGSRC